MDALKLSSKSNSAALPKPAFPATGGKSATHYMRATWESPRFFLLCLCFLIAGMIFWANVAIIDQVIRVEGKIIPAGRSQKIQHLEGGIIASINAAEGASVKKGDLLLTVDNTTADVDLGEMQAKLNSLRARALRLDAEVKGASTLVFPADLNDLPVSKAERSLFAAQLDKLTHEVAIHQDTTRQRTADIDEAEQRRNRLEQELATAKQRVDMVQKMAAQGAASRMELLDAQSREDRLRTEIGAATDSIPKFKAAISEEQSRIATARSDFLSQAHADLVTTLAEIERIKQAVTAAADRVKRTEIRAPIDGVINKISVNTVGGVIKSGEDLVELTPVTPDILIEARARPHDRGDLRPGLRTQVRVSAYDAGELGMLEGQVTEVSPDSIQDARGEPYYQVNILVNKPPDSYNGRALVPGMTVTGDIVTGHRTILAYLLSPLRRFTYTMFKDPR